MAISRVVTAEVETLLRKNHNLITPTAILWGLEYAQIAVERTYDWAKNSKGNLPTGEQLLKRKAYRDFFSYVSPSANEK